MNALLAILALLLSISIIILVPDLGPPAVIVCVILASFAGLAIYRVKDSKRLLLRLFVGGLLVRMLIGTAIYVFEKQDFFGGDSVTYDYFGYMMLQVWEGNDSPFYKSIMELYYLGGAWGMLYMVAAIYALIGRNPLAIQFVSAVAGAATAPVIFQCARHLFQNSRVAQISALFVAFYPSLVLWSSQGLKDGLIVFALALAILATLKLGEQFNTKYFVMLACALISLYSLRFYVFYMILAAIVGSFIVGMRALTTQSLLRQVLIVVVLGFAMTYLGVIRTATIQLATYGNLEQAQRGRQDQAQTANTGFAKDLDVSTTSGAISAIPIGMLYLLFAPFPWQLASLRQSITLPEMIVWWGSFPLLVAGLWFTLKYRLRQALPIILFTVMLTLVYSMFQGNVGTAYRQRSQLLVFYFIFVAVGFVLLKEKWEDQRQRALASKQAALQRRPSQVIQNVWNSRNS